MGAAESAPGQLSSPGTAAITIFFSVFAPAIPALLCNQDGTELYSFFTRLEIKRLACEELTTGLQKGLDKNPHFVWKLRVQL